LRATVGAIAISPAVALAQSAPLAVRFAPPVRIKAGDKFLGEKRLYPSPVFHDINHDGIADIVVGDLVGRITVALRQPGNPVTYGAETKLKDEDGKEIDFHNW
jgi:hypothetical protein